MKNPTQHPEYKINTIEDIGNLITEDNIDNFLKDFEGILRLFLITKQMFLLNKQGNQDFTPKIKDFTWIDDNEHKISIELTEEKKDGL